MSFAKFAVHHVVLVNILFFVFIGAGAAMYDRLPIDVYPDMSLDQAVITVQWFGASAEDVERLVTRKIEDEIEDARGINRIVSYSQQDYATLDIKFNEDLSTEEFEAAFTDLRTKLDRVTDLPQGSERPELIRLTTDEVFALLQIGVIDYGGVGEAVIRQVARDVKSQLRTVEGVARIREIVDRDREIFILIRRPDLDKHNISLTQVRDFIAAANLNIPAGNMDAAGGELTIRAIGHVEDPQDLAKIIIKKVPNGAHITLGDVADIEERLERELMAARYDGHPAFLLNIAKQKTSDAIELRNRLQVFLDDYQASLNLPGVEVIISGDSTVMIESRLRVLRNNLGLGISLVFLILWAAVGVRNSLLAIVGIPFSFLCAFIFMWMIGVSVNAVSVFALVLVSGIIVDDAIVVLENIYRHIQQGSPLQRAIIDGTNEVVTPICSAAATTVAAFLPMLLMTGVVGKFFSIIPKTVTVTIIASLFECLIILPAHYLDWGPSGRKRKKDSNESDLLPESSSPSGEAEHFGPIETRVRRAYDALVGQVLNHRYLFILGMACLMFMTTQAARFLRFDMFPSDFPMFVVDINARNEGTLSETDRVLSGLYPVLDEFKPDTIRKYSCMLGMQFNDDSQLMQRQNLSQVWMELNQNAPNPRDPELVMNDVRRAVQEYMDTTEDHGIKSMRVWAVRDGPPVGKPVAVRVEHPDYNVAKAFAGEIKDFLNQIDGTMDVADNLDLGPLEIKLSVDEALASERGLTFYEVATAMRGANDGLIAGLHKDNVYNEDLDIRVKYDRQYRMLPEDLMEVDVRNAAGQMVKLREVADLRYDQAFASLYHYNSRRAVLVTCNVDAERANALRINQQILDKFGPRADQDDQLYIHAGGQFEETAKSFQSLGFAIGVAVMLIYLILAGQFRSYLQPFVILATLIFGGMGMILGLLIHDFPFSMVTAIAAVGLAGIVVNDAIVLIDFVNQKRAQGMPVREALTTACQIRLRPIILTTVTTVSGLLPMAIGVGGYSKIWSPFAASVSYGMVSATLLTLILCPAFYFIVDDVVQFGRRYRSSRYDDIDADEAFTTPDAAS
jgi:HAE1 family hydrophobic/amphiphilic exporter-1